MSDELNKNEKSNTENIENTENAQNIKNVEDSENVQNPDDNNQENTDSSKKPSKKKKILRFVLETIKTIVILAICAGLGIYLAVGTRAGSPYRYAQKYFRYFASKNYSKMYEMTKTHEDAFINEDHFVYRYECEENRGGIKKYKFEDVKVKDGKYIYKVNYTTGAGKKDSMEIVLEEQKKKVYGLFSTWKVSLDNEIAKDCSIGVTEGLTGYLDHVSLDEVKNCVSEDGSTHYYFIKRMFKGEHVLYLNQDNMTSYSFSRTIENSGEQMVINSSMLELPNKDRDEMYNYSKLLLGSMYSYAMDGVTEYDNISYMFDSNETTQEICRNSFNNLRSETVHEDGSLLEQININNVSVALSEYNYPSDALISVAYTYSYVARTGRTSISGITKEYDGMGTAMAMIRFKLIDGVWKVTDLSMPCADYTNNTENHI